MANVADADDFEDREEGEAKPKRASKFALKLDKRTLMIAGAALLLIGGGAGAYLYFAPHEAAVEQAEAVPPSFVELPDMMVNLSVPSERPRYLKAKVTLEVSDEKIVEQVKPFIPRVVDSFQTHLREMRPEDLEGSAALYRLKEELLRRINQAVYPAKVDAILIKELLLQ
jgi:flagellar protein FliL